MKKIFSCFAKTATLKILFCTCSGITLLLLVFYLFHNTPDNKFERLLDRYLVEEASADGLTLHYLLANPEDYGIRNASHTFKSYEPQASFKIHNHLAAAGGERLPKASDSATNTFYTLFQQTNADALSPINSLTYDIFEDYLTQQLNREAFFYFEEPLTYSSGMHVQLPILLSEYTFRTEEDIAHYLTLLSSLSKYLDGILTFEQEKAEKGLFMSRYALKEVLTQCSEFITRESLAKETHLLQVSFRNRLENLCKEGVLSEVACETYIQQNHEILSSEILPAYIRLTNGLLALQEYAGESVGLCALPDGNAYYEYLIREKTGSDRSAEEMMDALKRSFSSDFQSLEQLLPQLTDAETFSLTNLSAQTLMEELAQKTEINFPHAHENESLRILPVEKELEDCVSPAFYLTPPIDAYNENVIYINEGIETDDLTRYTTLAHEGYPGHLFQTTYFYHEIEKGTHHPARALLSYPGYTEGYATYAEFYAYEFAKSRGNAVNIEAELLNQKLFMALYCMLDISIHYYGYDNDDTYECLAAFGIDDRRAAGELYEYIVNSPGTYLSYFVGYLEIMECRNLAEVCWKEGYSESNFHTFFLTIGPAPFSVIKEQIRAVDPDLIHK